MDTKDLLKSYIDKRTSGKNVFPQIVERGVETISGEVPHKLKIAITLSELITFVGHLRKPIKLFDDTIVPINAITFALSGSGTSKDKSLNSIRKALSTAYTHLENERETAAQDKAKQKALIEGDSANNWKKYYVAPKPLQAGLGTVEGLMHHFADINSNERGAGSLMSNEIGTELQTNGAMVEIIKAVSVGYDLGNIDPKIVKSSENQTSVIRSLPINALLFGSQEAILFNNEIKAKFKLIFNTQLARRSIFIFTPETPARMEITSVEDLYEKRQKERERIVEAYAEMDELVTTLVQNTDTEPLELTEEANKLYDVYMEYNSILHDEAPNKYPISKLSRKHKHWLALKIGAAYAVLNGDKHLGEGTYAYAINTVEYLSGDLVEFEKELVKEPYEQLCDYCNFNAENNEFEVSLHDLRKLSYISGAGASMPKVEELATLANSYDQEGTYNVTDGGIKYRKIVKSDIVGVSYKFFETTSVGEKLKEYMGRNCKSGFDFHETNFGEIALLLEENAVYGPFAFVDGERSKENLVGGTKFVVLDIDKSYITDEEAHELISDYNHYIVRTSDPNNEFKFRVILELDAPIDIDGRLWKVFIQEIADHLGLTIDPLPQSQVYFSFKNREILSRLDGETIDTKKFIDSATQKMRDKPPSPTKLPKKMKDLKLNDPRETFSYAFEAEQGERSSCMYRALMHAIDLGADSEYVEKLAREINEYLVCPMEEERLENTLINPALRKL